MNKKLISIILAGLMVFSSVSVMAARTQPTAGVYTRTYWPGEKEHLVDADDCIVFGDGENDKSMLSAFKKSYAMAWSKPSVKACAKNVTDSVVNTWNMIERNE